MRLSVKLFFAALMFFMKVSGASASPVLFFEEGWNLSEDLCPSGPADARRAKKFLPILVQDWNRNGQPYLSLTEKLIGKSWGRRELSFFYHVCPEIPDTSSPPSINLQNLLKSNSNIEKALTLARDTIWHELLHVYINTIVDVTLPSTPLLKKHYSLSGSVITHLHLMAVQQVIYQHVGRLNDAKLVRAYYQQRLPEYLKAWDIVAKEGPELYVRELQELVRNR